MTAATTTTDYGQFVATKLRHAPPVADLLAAAPNWPLFPWQRDLVNLALKRGRAALFSDTGTGKTRMELAWAHAVSHATGKPVLLLAPLAVGKQTCREAERIGAGAEAHYRADAGSVSADDRIVVTNYERLHHFEPMRSAFGGIVLDESSILKSMDGKTRKMLTAYARKMPYRLCATATPAPNDYIELGQHAEFLGVLTQKEMLALYFTQDGNSTQKWRLKGHAEQGFWRWLASWSTAMRRPSDVGHPEGDELYALPPLRVHQVEVVTTNEYVLGSLFKDEAKTLAERREARKRTLMDRVAAAVQLIEAEPGEQWLLWCDLNAESEALAAAIPGAIEVRGSDTIEHKESILLGFADGDVRILVTKPSIAGHGMNWQRCARVVFVGLSDSFERYYQAVRRCWRYGQTRPVDAYVVTADVEGAVVRNIESKQRRAEQMQDELIKAMADRTAEHLAARGAYEEDVATGDGWTLHLGDCVERLRTVEDGSIGLALFSPPFPSMYVYTDQARDMGNAADVREMIAHFEFLLPELMRVLMPGRSVAIHLAQAQSRRRDGLEIGLIDFRGETIAAMQRAGFTFYGEVTIDKSPQVKAVRTKDKGLLFKSLANDSADMRMAQADYLLQFRKPGVNPRPIRAGTSAKYDNEDGWITPEEWIEWAAPVWYRQSEALPGGIRETDTLNVSAARDERDERHLCPLQLGVIERAVQLWTAPGETVLSPFAGVGSEGYRALELGRRFVGVELKRSYWQQAIRNLTNAAGAQSASASPSLFDAGRMTKLKAETDARPAPLVSSGSPINALGAAVEGPRPSGAGSPICECGHPRTDHQDCGNGLVVCMHRVGPGAHPLDGICACCNYIDETERACECGCGRSLAGRRTNTLYALTACRMRAARKRNVSVTNAGVEPKRGSGPSGLQVSYAKAVRALVTEFRLLNLPESETRAVTLVRGMLSDRQRARLDEREGDGMNLLGRWTNEDRAALRRRALEHVALGRDAQALMEWIEAEYVPAATLRGAVDAASLLALALHRPEDREARREALARWDVWLANHPRGQ